MFKNMSYPENDHNEGFVLFTMIVLLVSVIGLIVGGAVYAGAVINNAASVPNNPCNSCIEACNKLK